jgi:hypothetical protein
VCDGGDGRGNRVLLVCEVYTVIDQGTQRRVKGRTVRQMRLRAADLVLGGCGGVGGCIEFVITAWHNFYGLS